jgi:hypothetical protein
MSGYEINPMKSHCPYATVSISKEKPNMLEIRFPRKKCTAFLDARAGADLAMAINSICREYGYAYIPTLGDSDEVV